MKFWDFLACVRNWKSSEGERGWLRKWYRIFLIILATPQSSFDYLSKFYKLRIWGKSLSKSVLFILPSFKILRKELKPIKTRKQ